MRHLFSTSLRAPFPHSSSSRHTVSKEHYPSASRVVLYQGIAQVQRCFPSTSHPSKGLSCLQLLLVALQKSNAQTLSISPNRVKKKKKKKKDTFKHCRFKFAEIYFSCKVGRMHFYFLWSVPAKCPPCPFLLSGAPEVMLFLLALVCTSPALGPWLNGFFQTVNFPWIL